MAFYLNEPEKQGSWKYEMNVNFPLSNFKNLQAGKNDQKILTE